MVWFIVFLLYYKLVGVSLLISLLLSGGFRLAALDASETTRLTSSEGRSGRETDLLLGIDANDERGDSDHLLSNRDVALTDEDTSVVDRLGHTALEDLSLETTLKKVAISQREDKIELVLLLSKDTDALEATEKGSSLEDATGIVGIQSEQSTGNLASLGKDKMDTPQLSLVLQTELSDEAELVLETLLLIRATGSLSGTAVCISQSQTQRETKVDI